MSDEARLMTGEGRSISDPTPLTTAMLIRELANLREILETRLDAMDKAIDLLAQYPTRMDEKISALRDLMDQKLLAIRDDLTKTVVGTERVNAQRFEGIETQFKERDIRTEQTAEQTSKAVDAALSAAKEAVEKQNQSSSLAISKSETATDKRIDQMGTLINTTAGALSAQINDAKERLTRIEGKGEGVSASAGWVIAGIGALVGIAGLIFALMK